MGSNESNNGSTGSLISSSSLLGNILFSKGRRKILALFFLHPDRQFYYREIIRITYSTPGPIQRELRLLTEAGILQVEKIGIQKFYRTNRACPIFEELRRIVQKTFGIVDVLGEALRPHRDRISLALIYGSVASGEDTAESDVDLLVVMDTGLRETEQALQICQQLDYLFGLDLLVITPKRLTERLGWGDSFLHQIIEHGKVLYESSDA